MDHLTNPSGRPRVLAALFKHKDDADCALNVLTDRGYIGEEYNILMSEETRKLHYSSVDDDTVVEHEHKTLEGTATGSMIGGTVGAVAAAIAAIGTNLILPGLGLVVAGPL